MSKTALLKIFVVIFTVLGAGAIAFLARAYRAQKSKKVLLLLIACLLPFLLGAVVYVDAFILEPNSIQVRRVNVKVDNAPRELTKLKMVQISDLHIKDYGFHERMVVSHVNKLKPDLLFITGDFLDSVDALRPMLKAVSRLKAARGIYAVLGDSDYYAFKGRGLKKELQNLGINVLENESALVALDNDVRLWIIGLSGKRLRGNILQSVFGAVPLSDPKIVLAHSPEVAENASLKKYGIDLILAGDTHGTQMGLAIIRRFSAYASRSKYVAGLYEVNGMNMYVNKGIGTKSKNMRFFCLPEISVVRLVKD